MEISEPYESLVLKGDNKYLQNNGKVIRMTFTTSTSKAELLEWPPSLQWFFDGKNVNNSYFKVMYFDHIMIWDYLNHYHQQKLRNLTVEGRYYKQWWKLFRVLLQEDENKDRKKKINSVCLASYTRDDTTKCLNLIFEIKLMHLLRRWDEDDGDLSFWKLGDLPLMVAYLSLLPSLLGFFLTRKNDSLDQSKR